MEEQRSEGDAPTSFSKGLPVVPRWLFISLDTGVRVALLLGAYIACALAVPPVRHLCAALMGLVSVGIVAGPYHECVHQNLRARPSTQAILGHALAAPLGLSYSWWRIKHARLHHRYPGDPYKDPDIGYWRIARVKEYQPWRPIYRYEPLFFLLFLPFATLNMALPFELHRLKRMSPASNLALLHLAKYGPFALFWAPLAALAGGYSALQTFVLFEAVAGVFGGIIAQLQHNTELSNTSDLRNVHDRKLRQLEATADTATHNLPWWWLSGGGTCHVAHHLNPRLTYYEARSYTAHVRSQFDEWPEHETVSAGIRSIWRMLKRLATPPGTEST